MLSDPMPVYELFHGYSKIFRRVISVDRKLQHGNTHSVCDELLEPLSEGS